MRSNGHTLKDSYYSIAIEQKPIYDAHGAFLGHEDVDCGYRAKNIDRMTEEQKQLLRQLCAPASKEAICHKLVELLFFRPLYAGEDGKAIVCAGIAKRLEGVALYAIAEAFNHYAFETEDKWFDSARYCRFVEEESERIREFLRIVENYIPAGSQLTKSAPVKEPPPTPYKDLPLEKQLETDAVVIKALGYCDWRATEFMDKIKSMPEGSFLAVAPVVMEVMTMINQKRSAVA